MFCQNCGKQNPDSAVFCDGCGASLSQSAQPAQFAEQPVQQPVQPKAPNEFVKKLLDLLTGYFKAPKATAAAAATEKEGLTFAGIFAGINFLAVFFFLWRFVGAYVTKLAKLAEEEDIAEYIEDLELAYPILPMLLAGLLITIIGIGAAALVVFLIAKLNKQPADLKQLLVIESINTLIPSALLVVGILLSFIAWWFLVVVLGIIAVLWIVNLCNELGQTENHLVPAGVIAVALIVAVLLSGVLANWSFGELSYDGETLNESRAEYRENIEDKDGIFDGETIIDAMVDTLIIVDYR